MTCVVTKACKGCKHTKCVGVCPTDAFYEGKDMLYINPDECIDCDACVNQCPEGAIYPIENLNSSQQEYIEINARESQKEGAVNILNEKVKKNVVTKKRAFKRPTKKKISFS